MIDEANQAEVLNSVLTEAEEMRRGNLLAHVLKLRRDVEYSDRWQTEWGTKTALGLFRSVERIIRDGE